MHDDIGRGGFYAQADSDHDRCDDCGRSIYQYDGVGVGDGMLMKKGEIIGSNTFTARDDIMLDQMMTFTPEAGCSVNVKIYAAKNGAAPTAGVKLFDKTFKKQCAGYSRTDLGQKVGIAEGMKFSVLVTTKTSGGEYFVPFEMESLESPLNHPAVVANGQTSVCIGGSWKAVGKATKMDDDVFGEVRLHNALIKVCGNGAGADPQGIKVKTKRKVKKGSTIKLNAKRTAGAGRLVYQTSDSGKASVSAKGVVKAKKKGTVKITVYALPTGQYKSVKKVVTVNIR